MMCVCVYMTRGKSSKKNITNRGLHACSFLFHVSLTASSIVRPTVVVDAAVLFIHIHCFFMFLFTSSIFYIPAVFKMRRTYLQRKIWSVEQTSNSLSLSRSLGCLCKLKDSGWWRHTMCCLSRRFYWLVTRKGHCWSFKSLSIIIIRWFDFSWNNLCYSRARNFVNKWTR